MDSSMYWQRFRWENIAPLCGRDWLQKHISDPYPEQWIEVKYDNKVIARVGTQARRGLIKKAIKEYNAEPIRTNEGTSTPQREAKY